MTGHVNIGNRTVQRDRARDNEEWPIFAVIPTNGRNPIPRWFKMPPQGRNDKENRTAGLTAPTGYRNSRGMEKLM
ncbi:MAG: hypothetical protein M0R02_10815, partial [Bacteroidales bacterium]|nr:hypothetical protein [Bacteroidales bacterium]